MKCQVDTRTTWIEADLETKLLVEVRSMVAAVAETSARPIETLRSEARMIPLPVLDPKRRCKDLAVAAAVTRVVATRAAAATETAAIALKAAVVVVATVTVAATEAVHPVAPSVAVVAPKSPLLLRAGLASSYPTISGSRLSTEKTKFTSTM